ncbi:MAG: septum formation initiator family protein [Deltaproteobacteria bacterium]|nr:septum formation initiator family protein [Deltaproteobacteria bacterium]
MRLFGLSRKKYLLCLAGLVSGMAFFTLFGGRDLMQIYQLRAEWDKIKAANVRLREENQKLAEQIERMKHSKEEVEKIAREELGLVRKGEIIYHFEP